MRYTYLEELPHSGHISRSVSIRGQFLRHHFGRLILQPQGNPTAIARVSVIIQRGYDARPQQLHVARAAQPAREVAPHGLFNRFLAEKKKWVGMN